MADSQSLFSQSARLLMSGAIICRVTREDLVNFLNESAGRERLDSYLCQIGLCLRSTSDGHGYFAAYRDLNDPAAVREVRRIFKEVINDLEPLVRWLSLVQNASPSEQPLDVGDLLHESDLLSAIERFPMLTEQLDRISGSGLLKNQSTGARKQLSSVLSRLADAGYLVASGSSGSVFRATAKWSRLHDIMRFINAHEAIDAEEDVPTQRDLVP